MSDISVSGNRSLTPSNLSETSAPAKAGTFFGATVTKLNSAPPTMSTSALSNAGAQYDSGKELSERSIALLDTSQLTRSDSLIVQVGTPR